MANLVELRDLIQNYDMVGIVDEAHATGVYGERGTGLVEHFAVDSEHWIRTGTLSKSMGSVGGFVAGSQILIDWLTNFARSYIYSTAAPASQLRRTIAVLHQLETMGKDRISLRQNAVNLRQLLRERGLRVGGVDSPIIAIYASCVSEVMAWSERLKKQGLLVPAIRPPTVPEGGCMLRVSINTSHTIDDFITLVQAFR